VEPDGATLGEQHAEGGRDPIPELSCRGGLVDVLRAAGSCAQVLGLPSGSYQAALTWTPILLSSALESGNTPLSVSLWTLMVP
jgi:hypothetical protein